MMLPDSLCLTVVADADTKAVVVTDLSEDCPGFLDRLAGLHKIVTDYDRSRGYGLLRQGLAAHAWATTTAVRVRRSGVRRIS